MTSISHPGVRHVGRRCGTRVWSLARWLGRASAVLLICGLGVAGGVGEARGAESEAGSGATSLVATVTFRLQNGLVLLPGAINGSERLSFLLDTGYSITTVHPALAESLGLRRAGSVTIVGIAGEEEAPTYAGAEIRVGGVAYAPRRVASVPSEAGRRRRRDGILGSGFLQRYVVQLDFEAKVARLHDPARFVRGTGAGGVRVPLRFPDDTPVVKAAIVVSGGRVVEGEFDLDTGCDDGVCLGRKFVVAGRLEPELGGRGDGVKRGVGGEAAIGRGRVAVLRLGGAEARDVTASLFRDGSPAGDGLAGHIGMGTLRQFGVTLDYRRRELVLEPRSKP